MTTIAIVTGTTRSGRLNRQVADWVHSTAIARGDAEYKLIDIADYQLPMLGEELSPTEQEEANRNIAAWSAAMAEADGFIFVTAEYNNSITAALKNALDYAYPEWNRKAAAFFSYGSAGGARAVQHLRDICVELQMAPVRQSVLIMGKDFYPIMNGERQVKDLDQLEGQVDAMLDQLSWWTIALKRAREQH